MDIARRSIEDPHSFAIPDSARVIDIHLELYVNFIRKVLHGNAILTIERNCSANEIILDCYKLIIKSVRNFYDKSHLKYDFGFSYDIGTPFTIHLPQTISTGYTSLCKIQIEYETSPNSPALHWLTSEQTADGVYPFLLSVNKLIYARAMFPCQDTPSVKFTYTAKILVPKFFKVLMSALLQIKTEITGLIMYEFLQMKPVPSYAVIIAVGSLQKRRLSARSNVYAENKFINESLDTFRSVTIKSMLETAKKLFGPYVWDRYDLCVLPPSIGNLKIECPCVTFISPAILGGDRSSIIALAPYISQSWAGNLVTCSDFNNLWLNRSFNMFISRKIICKFLTHNEIKFYLQKGGFIELNDMIHQFHNPGLLKCLLPDLTGLQPHDAIKYVPYEWGCTLLSHLEDILGGPSVFEPFLKLYFHKFAYASINTKIWVDYLYQYFHNKKMLLDNIVWNEWFLMRDFIPNELQTITFEREIYNIAQEWFKWNDQVHDIPAILTYRWNLFDFEKYILLNYLYDFHRGLTMKKLKLISDQYMFDTHSGIIQNTWLALCIKVRWSDKITAALNFAIRFCSANYACNIFRHLYEWTEVRPLAITMYKKHKEKMLYKTQKKLDIILQLN